MALCALLAGCGGGWLAALQGVAQGAQWLGAVVDVAGDGAEAFSRRHPNQERDAQIAAARRSALHAVATLNAVVATGKSASERDVAAARDNAESAYRKLYQLLDETGVLDGQCRGCGGAETDAPKPDPLPLPTPEQVAVALGGS
jgi:hypothetical protein